MLAACSSPTLSGVGAFVPNTQLSVGLGHLLPDGGGVSDQLNLFIALVDQGSLSCAQLIDRTAATATGRALRISLWHADRTAVTPGTYQIGVDDAGSMAHLSLDSREPDAGAKQLGYGASGTVTLTQVTPETTGSLDTMVVLFSDGGGQLTGGFNATDCGTQF